MDEEQIQEADGDHNARVMEQLLKAKEELDRRGKRQPFTSTPGLDRTWGGNTDQFNYGAGTGLVTISQTAGPPDAISMMACDLASGDPSGG